MQIRVLGHFGLVVPGEHPIAPPRLVAKVGTILAGWPGDWVERDRLIFELWGDRPPRTALNTLQAHISHLRKAVGKDAVVGDSNGYLLDVDPSHVDAEEFSELVQEAARAQRQMHLGRARNLLTQALDLWHGAPYRDVEDEELVARRARLEETWRIAQEDLLECKLMLARDSYQMNDAIACAKELVTREPLRERRHVMLIQALNHANRHAEASAAVENAVHLIRGLTGKDAGASIREALTDPTQQLMMPAMADARAGSSRVSEFNDVDQALLASVCEALVEHDVPTIIACLPEDQQSQFAEAALVAMRDDFPLGLEALQANDDVITEPSHRGCLRIFTHLDEGQILRLAERRSLSGSALLLLTENPPKQRVLIPVISANTSAQQQLARTS
jgi:DNA-binding SARP family transcriptional activator